MAGARGRPPLIVVFLCAGTALLLLLAGIVWAGVQRYWPKPYDPPAPEVVVLLDVSESVLRGGGTDTIADCLTEVVVGAIPTGGTVVLRPVGTSSALSQTTVDLELPDDVRGNDSKIQDWSDEKAAALGDAISEIARSAGGSTTDLAEGLLDAQSILAGSAAPDRRLLVISDFSQTEGELDLNRFVDGGAIDWKRWSKDVDRLLVEDGKEGGDGPLQGVDVFGLTLTDGTGTLTPFESEEVVEHWRAVLDGDGHLDAARVDITGNVDVCRRVFEGLEGS